MSSLLQEALKYRDERVGKTEETVADKLYAGVRQREEKKTGLDPASIWERTVAAGVSGGDENLRKQMLLDKGKDPQEEGLAPPWKREFWADIAESSPPFVKAVMQTVAEKAGIAGGTALVGPIGIVPGKMVGGALGRGGAQAGYETAARLSAMEPEGAGKRIAGEAATGAITSGAAHYAGVGLQKAIEGVKAGGKTVSRFVLGQISKIPEKMRTAVDNMPGGWQTVVKGLEKAGDKIAVFANRKMVPAIKQYKSLIGRQWADATKEIVDNPANKIDMRPAQEAVKQTIDGYASKLSPADMANLKHVDALLKQKNIPLQKVYQTISKLDNLLRDFYLKYGDKVQDTDPYISMLKSIQHHIKSHIHTKFPVMAQADALFSKSSEAYYQAIKHWGDTNKAMEFMSGPLWEGTGKDAYGRHAFSHIDNYLKQAGQKGFKETAEFRGLQEFLAKSKVAPSGFQFGIAPKVVGGTLGAGAGIATTPEGGTPQDMMTRAAVGGGVGIGAGYMAETPFISPRYAAETLARVQKLGQHQAVKHFIEPATKGILKGAGFAIKHGAKLAPSNLIGRPVLDAVEAIRRKFVDDTPEQQN